MSQEHVNTLQINDSQLQLLNDIVRAHQVNISNEDLALVAMGRKRHPVIDLTILVGRMWEERQQVLNGQRVIDTPPAE